MKKLLTALATAATAALGFAEITAREDFEDSSYTAYDNDTPSQPAAYPFDGYGDYYRSLDDDVDEELPADGASCVDAVMQFKYADVPDEFDGTEKLVVFANSDGKLVVVDADATNVTTTAITEDTWYRLTIVSVDETVNDATIKKFKVYVNGASVATEGGTDSFTSRVANSYSVTKMTLSGTGKVDNFVARTTDPFGGAPAGWIANIGTDDPEQYFTDYTKALEKALAGATLTFADGVTEMDGSAEHPFEIRSAADLVALQQAVATTPAARAYNYRQTANIDMTEAGAFAGIGVYNATPTAGTPFTGTYDGGGFKICNVDFTQRNYGGVFNQVNGGTIKNLTVSNITCSAFSSSVNDGEWGGAIVGNIGNGATLQNLVAEGTFAADHPATHNVAGIVIRACGGGENGTLIKDCTNNATLYGAYTKIGGICAITQYKIAGGAVTFDGCVNNGDIISSRTTATGVTGYAGILGYNDDNTVIVNCSNTGSIVNESGANTDKDGAIVGWAYTKDANGVRSLTDQGGNSAAKTDKMLAFVSDLADVTGFKYATVANDVATTVTSLSAGNTYLLEGSVAASETPVFTFAEAGTISFDAALGYTFAGTVDAVSSLAVTTSTSGTVTTYTAAVLEPAVAKIGTKEYTSLAAALAAAESGDTVTLATDIAVTAMQCISGKAVTLDLAGFAITAGTRSAEAATAGDDSILCVLHGGSLTINDSSAGGTGAITGNSVFTTGVKMTKKGDTNDTNKATLVVNGGIITGYYYGIAGNGLAGRGNTEVTINGGTIKGTCANNCVAIFQPQLGTLTINGGYLEGAMGVYVKSGTATVAINGGTIKGNGTYAAYVHSTNGFNNTGDAFVVDNAGYPGGAPAPSILGGTFVSVNASAIASYAKTGLERIVHFADKDAVTITEAKASSEDVFLEKGFPGGSDDKTFTIDTAVQAALAEKIPAGKALTDAVEGTTSGVTYAQAYALGLLDETTGELEKDVTPTISIVNGTVVVSLDANAKDAYKVTLTVYESTSLNANATWLVKATYELDSEEEAAGFTPSSAAAGFYKVGVTIEDATSGN